MENENGHGKVMEHEKLNCVIELRDQSWNSTNFAPELYQIVFFLSKELSSDLESQHFPTFFAKLRKFKIGEIDGYGIS